MKHFLVLHLLDNLPWRRKATEGERVIMRSIQIPRHASSFRHATRATFLPEEGLCARRFSADSGFGLLPDYARTSTRYACPGRKRRESGKYVLSMDMRVTQPT